MAQEIASNETLPATQPAPAKNIWLLPALAGIGAAVILFLLSVILGVAGKDYALMAIPIGAGVGVTMWALGSRGPIAGAVATAITLVIFPITVLARSVGLNARLVNESFFTTWVEYPDARSFAALKFHLGHPLALVAIVLGLALAYLIASGTLRRKSAE